MRSIRDIYKIGKGPSSSHTMGPAKAMEIFVTEHPDAEGAEVILYGSLADTGRGHGTDHAIELMAGGKPVNIIFDTEAGGMPHENTLDIYELRGGKRVGAPMRVMSVGGGDISIVGRADHAAASVYHETTFTAIAEYCKREAIRLSDYVFMREGEGIEEFLYEVWDVMKSAIHRGLTTCGILPGGLEVERKAQYLYNQRHIDESQTTKQNRIVCSYAFAVSEENADNGTIVTAPTCGACAVLPAVLKYTQEREHFSDELIIRALAVAGLVGTLVKTNASISGAECGCQAEIGTACSMAAAALAELYEMGIDQIEYAAEVAFEHHLGLTCDPICGLVQIPCIERNAVAAMRAINAVNLANFLSGSRKISLDMVIKTMYETGKDMSTLYRETAAGGLAKHYHGRK
ncbi:MAG: L-serine ammonia-lyase, iron-sulfur-dependent, subunit alpha [Clostridia bacterium]|nr:L-serine ammonia-lyase, iron-sulfur-dependent, subunit alpha [Clostridia bacterium]MBQ8371726.1 L-serine ammonia-lyase, iron-sulfur-dependent, subunit alpha [Clostridia bacterium]